MTDMIQDYLDWPTWQTEQELLEYFSQDQLVLYRAAYRQGHREISDIMVEQIG